MKNKRITNMRKERGISTMEEDIKDDILFQIDTNGIIKALQDLLQGGHK